MFPDWSYGYPTLFLLSFLAATLLPLGSEWLLAAMVTRGADLSTCLLVATGGNLIGSLTSYAVGLWGGPILVGKVLRIDHRHRQKAEQIYRRFGVWSLLFAWMPVIGDPLCVVGGALRVGLMRFVPLVAIGKFARYFVIALAVYQG